MVLLIDRRKAAFFTLQNGSVIRKKDFFKDEYVPQVVKHGNDTWDAQNKIFRHIEDHLHRHLTTVIQKAQLFIGKEDIAGILIGSHKTLFTKIKQHLVYPLNTQVKGYFVVGLTMPFNTILARVQKEILRIDK